MTSGPPQIPGLTFVTRVGSGGYADVYQYEHHLPRMPVAVKVLKSEGLTDAVQDQFTAEADTMARLADHPYIVQVFGAGVADGDRPYLVMEYYPPPNLAVRVRERRCTVQQVLRMGIQLASAVETAHRAGITHRDIKPANVLLTQYGDPGLIDFGIAGRGASDDADEDRGVSVPWAAPEVVFGLSAGDVAADVYGLAATLWHLLVGRSPFEVPGEDNSTYALMPRIRSNPVPPTRRPDARVSLERLLQQAMAKDPSVRPPTAMALARALRIPVTLRSTRYEQARELEGSSDVAPTLAGTADRYVFGPRDPDDQQVGAYWDEVMSARRGLRTRAGGWRRLRADVMLASAALAATPRGRALGARAVRAGPQTGCETPGGPVGRRGPQGARRRGDGALCAALTRGLTRARQVPPLLSSCRNRPWWRRPRRRPNRLSWEPERE